MSVQYKDENGILQKGAGLYKSEVPIGIADIYTEGERQVGLWIDGKPLYQRTFDLGSDVAITNNAFTNTTIDASSMETLVDAKAIYSTGVTRYNVMANISNGVIRLQADRNDTGINARYIVLQYTKTTDTSTGVLPKSASALYLLGDVEISNLQDGDVLKYDDDDNKWKNGVGGGGGNANIWTGTQAELEEVFDELEEGTQINITDDEQEVVEGGTIYSEEEQVIGLWLDNRPLYQKTINCGTLPNNATKTVAHGISNIDTIVNTYGHAKATANQTPIPFVNNTSVGSQVALFADATNITLRTSEDKSPYTGYVTIQYTKTTDAPLDAVVGKSTMYIASSDCYSTEEKEVGCYVDGKPIYQKTVIQSASTSFTNRQIALSSLFESITNVDRIVDAKCQLHDDKNNRNYTLTYNRLDLPENIWLQIMVVESTHTIGGGILTGVSGSSTYTTISNIVVTIQYTKTTDTAGSGQYTPASGKAVHYSTDEQVIGTWIDGSTLYRKTLTGNLTPSGASYSEVVGTLSALGASFVTKAEGFLQNTAEGALYKMSIPSFVNSTNASGVYISGVGDIRLYVTGTYHKYYLTLEYIK